jgi:hypothetical protein
MRNKPVKAGTLRMILGDRQFYFCLLLGPLIWWLITFVHPPRTDFAELPGISWYPLLAVLLVFPVLEEVVFRGLVQEWIAGKLLSRLGILSAANLLTSLVFVAAHLIYSQWPWALLVFFPSLVFGYLKERHQSLLSPIIMHSFYNAGFVWLFWR